MSMSGLTRYERDSLIDAAMCHHAILTTLAEIVRDYLREHEGDSDRLYRVEQLIEGLENNPVFKTDHNK